MILGDKIRLKATPACRDILGLGEGSVGVVKEVDVACDKPSVLISFPDLDVYTSALQEQDYEVLQPSSDIRANAS